MEETNRRTKFTCIIASILVALNFTAHAQNWDINSLKSINLNRNKNLDGPMTAITNSVYPIAIATPITELITGYAKHDKKIIQAGWTTIAGSGINFIVAFGLKYTVNRDRPYVTYPVLQPYQHDKDPSFPSGHSSFAFNTATSLVLHFPKWYVAVPAYAWSTTVAYSRMHLGMHYPSDVLTGAVIGATSSLLAYKGNKWILGRRKLKHSTIAE